MLKTRDTLVITGLLRRIIEDVYDISSQYTIDIEYKLDLR